MDKHPDKKEKKPSSEESEFLGMNVNISVDHFEEHFPAIHTEITEAKKEDIIDRAPDEDPFSNYEPNVYDFLERAKTDKEGFELLDYLVQQKQISTKTAKQLKNQITESGIRSFGPIRTINHYFRKAAEVHRHRIIKKRHSIKTDKKTEL
jgi:hypothetical protein